MEIEPLGCGGRATEAGRTDEGGREMGWQRKGIWGADIRKTGGNRRMAAREEGLSGREKAMQGNENKTLFSFAFHDSCTTFARQLRRVRRAFMTEQGDEQETNTAD